MSGARGDCKHGHAAAVMELAKKIGLEHGMAPKSAALVIFDPHDGLPTVIGQFNTADLGTMADAVLAECAKHEPDGCEMCDPMGIAAELAVRTLRLSFGEQRRHHLARSGKQS